MAVSEVIPICPTIKSLCDPIKGRPRFSIKNDVKKVYHCPVETCKYFQKDHHFEKLKFLRQHFVKVHKTRTFACDKCGVQFPLESTLSHHKLICGVSYQCYCSAEYKSYEALLTHFKRKHNENACVTYKDMMGLLKAHSTAQDFQKSVDNVVDVKAIVMKNLDHAKLLVLKEKKNKTALSKETQTGMKMCKILPNAPVQLTEVPDDQQPKKTVSMQTTTEFGHRKRKRSKICNSTSKIDCSATSIISFSTSSTQTTPVKEEPVVTNGESGFEILPGILPSDDSCSLSFNDREQILETQKTSAEVSFGATMSSTLDDNPDGSDFSCHLDQKRMISTDDPNFGFTPGYIEEKTLQLEESKSDFSSMEFVANDSIKPDFNLIMCSDSETQTPFEDFFDSSFMDTYTQTCDSFFSDLDFVDIETQTF